MIPSAWCSSTRPGPPPTWHGDTGAASGASACASAFPHGHWKTTTFVGALTLRGFIAPFVLDGAINRDAFETYVAKVLIPELRAGDVVVMDNLPGQHRAAGPRTDRGRWSTPALPSAIQSGLQPDRECLLETQGAPPQGGRAHRRGPLAGDRTPHRPVPALRVRQFLRRRRLRYRLIGFRSKGAQIKNFATDEAS